MEKSYKVASGSNGFNARYTQAWLEEQHLQLRHVTEEGEEFKFEVQPSGWKENGKTLEAVANGHTIRLWIDPEGDTHIFIAPEKEEKKRVSRLW